MILISELVQSVAFVYICAAILPAIFLMTYIEQSDTYDKEPASLLFTLVVLGVGSALLALVLEKLTDAIVLANISFKNEVWRCGITATSVGLIEEGCKFYLLRKRTWNDINFNYRYDGVVYSVFLSLGFAAFENLLYVINYGLSVAGPRALLAVPAHMGFAVFMGAFYGRAKMCHVYGDRRGARLNLWAAYLVAVALHSFYDSTAMINTATATSLFVTFVIMMYIIVIRKVKKESTHDERIF